MTVAKSNQKGRDVAIDWADEGITEIGAAGSRRQSRGIAKHPEAVELVRGLASAVLAAAPSLSFGGRRRSLVLYAGQYGRTWWCFRCPHCTAAHTGNFCTSGANDYR